MSNKRSVDFWNEIKKIKGTHKAMPGMVDGAQTEEKISQIFSRKYDRLYSSVSYDETDMSLLQDDISKSVSSHLRDSGPDCICKRGVSVNLVEQAMAVLITLRMAPKNWMYIFHYYLQLCWLITMYLALCW